MEEIYHRLYLLFIIIYSRTFPQGPKTLSEFYKLASRFLLQFIWVSISWLPTICFIFIRLGYYLLRRIVRQIPLLPIYSSFYTIFIRPFISPSVRHSLESFFRDIHAFILLIFPRWTVIVFYCYLLAFVLIYYFFYLIFRHRDLLRTLFFLVTLYLIFLPFFILLLITQDYVRPDDT